MKRFVGLFGVMASAGILATQTARAADLLPPPPPPQQYVADSKPSCIYARVDGGVSFHQRPDVSKTGGAPFGGSGTDEALDEKIKELGFVEGGVGCQFTDIFRAEITGGYRFKSSLTDPYGTLNGKLGSYTGFVNVYWDMTNYNGFTPYLGAGAGIAYNRLTGVTLPATAGSGKRLNFAYNVMAGVSYDITESVKLDLAYRYIDLGNVVGGGTTPLKVEKLRAHEVKLGVRYQFGSW